MDNVALKARTIAAWRNALGNAPGLSERSLHFVILSEAKNPRISLLPTLNFRLPLMSATSDSGH